MSGFVGVYQDHSGKALQRARLYARAVGLSPLYETTPTSEALGDLFGEQALLCGGLVGLASAVAKIMVKRGISPVHAYYETVAQLEQLSRLLAESGVEGFWNEISDCAAAGAVAATPKLFDRRFMKALERVWDDIDQGQFAHGGVQYE